MSDGTLVAGGLGFLEAPRWHNDELWFSDFYSRWVCSVDLQGKVTRRLFVPGQPSGLAFGDDGAVLIASIHDARVHRWDGSSTSIIADVGTLYRGGINDMVSGPTGGVYISALPLPGGSTGDRRAAPIVFVSASGDVRIVAEDLHIPNGMVIASDGAELVVAETWEHRLLSYDIGADGSLAQGRVFADLGSCTPDGICIDGEGRIWVSSLHTSELVLVERGGRVVRRIGTDGRLAVACALGGSNQDILFSLEMTADYDYHFVRGTGSVRAYRVE